MPTATLKRRTAETFESMQPGTTVNRTSGIVPGVLVIGFEAKNRRHYPPNVLKESVHLYEVVKVNIDHPDRPGTPRKFGERFGTLRNCRYVENKGIVADLHYNPEHPAANQFAWEAENNPSNVGFSHDAQIVNGPSRNGVVQVSKIVAVRSVDVVADPATTNGIFESVQMNKQDWREKVTQEPKRVVEEKEPQQFLPNKGVLKDVIILDIPADVAEKHPRSAIERLMPLLAAADVHFSHPEFKPEDGERIGKFRKMRIDGTAVVGELHLVKKHKLYDQFLHDFADHWEEPLSFKFNITSAKNSDAPLEERFSSVDSIVSASFSLQGTGNTTEQVQPFDDRDVNRINEHQEQTPDADAWRKRIARR